MLSNTPQFLFYNFYTYFLASNTHTRISFIFLPPSLVSSFDHPSCPLFSHDQRSLTFSLTSQFRYFTRLYEYGRLYQLPSTASIVGAKVATPISII